MNKEAQRIAIAEACGCHEFVQLSAPLYAVHPGPVISRTDRQEHHLGFLKLCELYGVQPGDCVDMSREREWRGKDVSKLIPLTPRYDGNYALPNTRTNA